MELVADRDEPAVELDRAACRGRCRSTEPEQLASSHAGGGEDPECGEEPVAGGSGEERLQLLGGPGLGFDLGDRPEPWCVGDERDVAG